MVDAQTKTDLFFKVISAIGAITGSWALIRSYWLTRSKLVLSQKSPEWCAYHEQGGVGTLEFTLIIANHSSQANAIVRWEAWLRESGGKLRTLEVIEGQSTDSKTKEVVNRFNVVPFNVAPHAAVDCLLTFFNIRKSEFKLPFELRVKANDMYDKTFECICTYNPVSDR